MKQTMKWLFVKDEGESVVLRCSVCNSEITVKYGEELPYCKHCECEPECDIVIGKIRYYTCEPNIKLDNKLDNLDNNSTNIMTDDEIVQALKHDAISEFDHWVIDLINRQKAEIETYSQNIKQLTSDHRILQQSFDNVKGLYEKEKAKVEKAKEKCIALMKELQTAKIEIERLQHKNAELQHEILSCKSEAVKEFAERLKRNYEKPLFYIGGYNDFIRTVDNLVKEMAGDAE